MIVPDDKAISTVLVAEAITHRSSHARSGRAILIVIGRNLWDPSLTTGMASDENGVASKPF